MPAVQDPKGCVTCVAPAAVPAPVAVVVIVVVVVVVAGILVVSFSEERAPSLGGA
jgi:hypothetical protein